MAEGEIAWEGKIMLKEWSKKKISVVKEKMFCGLSKEFGHEYGKAKKKSGFIQKKIRSVKFKLYKKWREEIDKREFLEMKEFLENMPWRPLGYTLGYYDKEYDAVHSIFDYTIGDEKKELKQDCFKKIFQDNKNDSIVLLGNNATRAVKIYYRIFIFFKSLNDYFEQKSDRNTIEILQSMWTTPLAKLTQEDIEDMKQELRGVKNLVDGKTLE